MGSDKDLIVGNWLISKHICENHTTHARSLGTVADLAGQLEAAAHAIVHAMKPSGQAEGYSQQKMCLGQVVSSKACDGDTSSSAYACACFDKAAAANRGQGIKFINHLLTAANALRRLQRLRDDVTRHNDTVTAIEKHRLSAKEKRADTGNTGKINTSARAGKGEQEQQTNVAAGKGAAATTESACEQMGANGTRTGRRAAQHSRRRGARRQSTRGKHRRKGRRKPLGSNSGKHGGAGRTARSAPLRASTSIAKAHTQKHSTADTRTHATGEKRAKHTKPVRSRA
ncbi:hypothetical protein ERJ75_000899900 [Trypanosoma vivax]|nr:hypothetical protein ERJ75_000899900 [Trypanosoma vivax]